MRHALQVVAAVAAVLVGASWTGCGSEDGGEPGGGSRLAIGPAPDYILAALTDPPAAALNGATFAVTTTVRNVGDAAAVSSSTTRYFLSVDTQVGGDFSIARSTAVPPLAVGAENIQTTDLAIPKGVPSASYFLVACADRSNTVPERDNRNNCSASAGVVTVTGPDLVVDAVSEPPASIQGSFSVTDTVRNAGTASAGASKVAYYLSPVPTRGPGTYRMVARRSVGPLAIGQTSGGTVVVAPTAPPGSYFLLACADVSAQVTESDEKNNCKASVGTGAMGPPDLVVSSIGDPPAALVTGGSFLVSDTTANTGHLTAPESITRFFLSTDELPGDDREVETGSRVVRPLAAGEASTRLTDITLDPATPPGSYFLLACADAGGAVGEPSEANNCRASAGRVTVTSTSCGDGVLAGTETCDDGNTDDDDGCDRDCVPTAVTQLAAGSFHNCALLRSGAVRCWGYAGFGQLGYPGDEIPRQNIGDDETPASAGNVEVGGRVAELTAGWAHTCARLVTGAVRCWGWADDGQLGYGNSVDIGDNETPASAGDVELGGSAVKLTAGRFHNCALLDGGAVRCWGSGAFGALGYGSMANIGDNETPASAGDVDVGGAVVDLDAGMFHTCAVLADGHARCWGHGGNGRLGHGNSEYIGDDETPASAGDVDVGGAVVELATGGDHTCARLDTGAVRCWGYAWYGVLGYGTQDDVGDDETPASAGDVDVGGAAAEIDAGYDHVCARLEGGSVRCWGHGFAGTLGHASTETIGDDETPASAGDVSLGGQAVQLVTGWNHTCARLDGGAVRCWGYGGEGELGYGNRDDIGDDETPASAGPVEIF